MKKPKQPLAWQESVTREAEAHSEKAAFRLVILVMLMVGILIVAVALIAGRMDYPW